MSGGSELIILRLIALGIVNTRFFSILKILCKKRIEKRSMVVPEIMFSSFFLEKRCKVFLTPVIVQIIAPYNIYSIKFVNRSFRAIKVIF